MCSNYAPSARQQLMGFDLPPPDFSYGEAYPGLIAPTVTNFAPRLWVPACFGLVPAWAKDTKIVRSTYNARSETVGEKPSFREAWRRGQLCIIPADVIFEPCYETGRAVRWRIERVDRGLSEPPQAVESGARATGVGAATQPLDLAISLVQLKR